MSMGRLLAMWVALLVAFAAPASAHRLDEYLQATTVSVTQGVLTMRIGLTPGVSVAGAVLARIVSSSAATPSA